MYPKSSVHRHYFYCCAIFFPTGGKILEPKAGVVPLTKAVKLGERANFSCQALGDSVHISWYRNGRPVPANQIHVIPQTLYHNKYTKGAVWLVIERASTADSGRYTCEVTTKATPGYKHQAHTQLTVGKGRAHTAGGASPHPLTSGQHP